MWISKAPSSPVYTEASAQVDYIVKQSLLPVEETRMKEKRQEEEGHLCLDSHSLGPKVILTVVSMILLHPGDTGLAVSSVPLSLVFQGPDTVPGNMSTARMGLSSLSGTFVFQSPASPVHAIAGRHDQPGCDRMAGDHTAGATPLASLGFTRGLRPLSSWFPSPH